MAYLLARRLRSIIVTLGYLLFVSSTMSAQASPYRVVTTDSLRSLAEELREDLQNGSVQMADLHAIQLRLALLGVLREETSTNISAIERTSPPDEKEPQLTRGLVPVADKLIQALDDSNVAAAKSLSAQLSMQIHAQHEVYLSRQAGSSLPTEDSVLADYYKVTDELGESLLRGDIPRAAVLAIDVQNAKVALQAKRKTIPFNSRNIYNINDALGRAAFLSKDYLAAGDYLLKAADTPGKDSVLTTFGPDLWLARALLRVGQKDVVLTFLQRIRNFWSKPRLDEWIAVLETGGSPDLWPNVRSTDPVLAR